VSPAGILKARKNEGNPPLRSAVCPANFSVAQERDPPGASGAGDVSDLLHYFYISYTIFLNSFDSFMGSVMVSDVIR
jgi:hypothetical protein